MDHRLSFPLFVPADRPDRFAKACAAGTDSVIIDVEDAVAPDMKSAVRRIPQTALPDRSQVRLLLRVNGVGTPWHHDDVAFARATGFDGVMLPKTDSADQVAALRAALDQGVAVIALIETVAGLAHVEEIAVAADRLAFGSIDFCEDLACANDAATLLPVRSRIAQAARLAGRPAPIDGVTVAHDDPAAVTCDARHAARIGFGGKLLIHPRQIVPARAGFLPDPEQVAWAERIVAASGGGAAISVEGEMVDTPVIARARRILQRAGASQ
ncbi:CoA ester lyase [Paracoccus aestuarii]|uniref:CoA ester lyase n=1 Tax=Paracoccus aestuarii TaxID=453842 RepID=A0A418ZR33_9RHOB|nr:CoA ester lyase [Paracoccus aestuarii]RJK98613.1 CoA ester lyase [Paracoccus aestuarii]